MSSLMRVLRSTLFPGVGHSATIFARMARPCADFRVTRALDLILLRFCEGNAKQTNHVSVGGTAVNISFNNGLLLTDQTAKLITGHVHSVEVEEAIVSLNVFDAELNFTVGKSLILCSSRQETSQ
jgi:hypothetical protein